MKPKSLHSRSLAKAKPAAKYCANCGAKLSAQQTRDKLKFCDATCRQEATRLAKLARRPQEVHCAACGAELDVLARAPKQWHASELHFCDGICVDAYRRQTGAYTAMSQTGNEVMREYKEKHGKVHNYEDRAKATARNNRTAPPKAKHFQRSGSVWGYEVIFYPDEDAGGYRTSIPELEEIAPIICKTKKEGLLRIREKIMELRQQERQNDE